MNTERKAILCIDDETIILDSLREQLEKNFGEDFIYETAESAEEAFEIIDELEEDGIEIAIIVCDWLMPGMKGDKFLLAFLIVFFVAANIYCQSQKVDLNFTEITVALMGALIGIIRGELKS